MIQLLPFLYYHFQLSHQIKYFHAIFYICVFYNQPEIFHTHVFLHQQQRVLLTEQLDDDSKTLYSAFLQQFSISMKPSSNYRYIIKNDACEFDLQQTFNQLSMFALNPPQIASQKQILPPISIHVPTNDDQSSSQNKENLVQVLSEIKGLKNTLRYIKLNPKLQTKKPDITIPSKKLIQGQGNQVPIDKQIFIRPTQSVINGNKTFWMIKGLKQSNKKILNLDSPTFVITFNNAVSNLSEGDQILIAIERNCLTLYEIDGSDVLLRDFDSVSLQKKLNVIEMKHVQYMRRNYVLIFGNEKEKKEEHLICMVYEVVNQRFVFVKKALLWKGQIYSPTILFDNYPKNEKEKYCLIIGGFKDNKSTFYSHGLQVDIHLLVTSWLLYPIELTREVPFDTKRQNILSGKAIKYNDFWYVFCTQYQTITQIKMDYQHGIWLEILHLSTKSLQLKQKIYFGENNLFLTLKGALKLIMLNASLEFREKDFIEIIERFDNH